MSAIYKPNIATPVTVPNGGTGVTTLGDAGVLIGNGTGNVQVTGAGLAGQVLTSNGAGVDPTFENLPGTPEFNYSETITSWLIDPGQNAGYAQFAVEPGLDYGFFACKDQDGSPSPERINVYRFVFDPNRVFWLENVNATFDTGTFGFNPSDSIGLVVTASFVYIATTSGSNIAILRTAHDFTSPTLFTISGTAYTGQVLSGAGTDTDLYFKSVGSATQVLHYTLSGTTATRTTDITLTAGIASQIAYDGTDLINYRSNDFARYTTAGGAATATTYGGFNFSTQTLDTGSFEITQNTLIGIVPYSATTLVLVSTALVNESGTDSMFFRFKPLAAF